MPTPGRIVFDFGGDPRSIDIHVEAPLLRDWLHDWGSSGFELENQIEKAIVDPESLKFHVDEPLMDLLCAVLSAHREETQSHQGLRFLRIAACNRDRVGD
jgi:hypothetical protein